MVSVLRLGHRPDRDKRMSTHVCLTARALGADGVCFPELDNRLEQSVTGVTERFGSDFTLKEARDWKKLVREWDGDVVHLTMYGINIDEFLASTVPKNPWLSLARKRFPGKPTKWRITTLQWAASPIRKWRPWRFFWTG